MASLKLSAFADEASSQVAEQIKALNENGIGYIEPRGLNGENISEITLEKAKEYTKQFNDAGIKIWSVGSPIGKVDIADDFAKELDRFKHCIDVGMIMGAECIRLFSFYGTGGKAEYKDEVCERLAKFVEVSKGSGITLCHENEKGIYGDIAPRCVEIHKAVPEVKCVFDGANFVQSNQAPWEAWEMLKGFVKYCHIKDALADGKIVAPGYGITEIEKYLADFNKMGGGVITIEPHLSNFVGLQQLSSADAKNNVGSMSFASNREAFDFAVSQTKKLAKI